MPPIPPRSHPLVVPGAVPRCVADLQSVLTRLPASPAPRGDQDARTDRQAPVPAIPEPLHRSEMLTIERLITDNERSNRLIDVVDGALGQVAACLQEIHQAVRAAAEESGCHEQQFAARQMRIDSLLDDVNRIGRTATVHGRSLLSGSLDFLISAATHAEDLTDLEIRQADLGSTGSLDIEIAVSAAAAVAEIRATVATGRSSRLPADDPTGLAGDLSFKLTGSHGTRVFHFSAGTAGEPMAAAIDRLSGLTGVSAAFSGDTLTLTSSDCGSHAFVAVDVFRDGGDFEAGLSAARAVGRDVAATVNGMAAHGDGHTLSISTSRLELTASIAAGRSRTIRFSIAGGGVLFPAGRSEAARGQVRIGIPGIRTSTLGGPQGRLCQIGSTADPALDVRSIAAGQVVDEAIAKVASLRGRLGAFQKTTIEANIFALNETMTRLIDADGAIRDAEVAVETAQLVRAQILVQPDISVLSIAGRVPAKVACLSDLHPPLELATASVEQVQRMLIESAIRCACQAVRHWDADQGDAALETLVQCRRIVAELLRGVQPAMSEVAGRAGSVYLYLFQTLTDIGLHRQRERMADVRKVLEAERETWRLVCDYAPADPRCAERPAIEEAVSHGGPAAKLHFPAAESSVDSPADGELPVAA